jgi:hypothetical protein
LSVPENHKELLQLWDGFHVDQHERNIRITIKAGQDMIDRLVSLFQSGELGPHGAAPGVHNRPQ